MNIPYINQKIEWFGYFDRRNYEEWIVKPSSHSCSICVSQKIERFRCESCGRWGTQEQIDSHDCNKANTRYGEQ